MYQLTKSEQITAGQRKAEYCIDSVSDLADLEQRPTSNVCMGSVAYTPSFDIFTLTANGWVDDNGTVVSN